MAALSIDELDKHVREFYEGRGAEVTLPDAEISISEPPPATALANNSLSVQQKTAQQILNQVRSSMCPLLARARMLDAC